MAAHKGTTSARMASGRRGRPRRSQRAPVPAHHGARDLAISRDQSRTTTSFLECRMRSRTAPRGNTPRCPSKRRRRHSSRSNRLDTRRLRSGPPTILEPE